MVVALLRAEANAISAATAGNVCGINTHVDSTILGLVQAGARGLIVGDVVDIAIGWVIVLVLFSIKRAGDRLQNLP